MVELSQKEKKRFSVVARINSANHAWRGIKILLSACHNMWGHIFFSLVAVYLGFILEISSYEWIAIVFAIALVVVTETLNTAIEIDMDLTSPDFHPYARDTKDVAAGGVLLAVVFAIIIGMIVFLPKIYPMLI
ncbi:MAG TPA: diacylglycerol kinase family protein [Candidatus Paceibacterota bacterium]|nr:diacylglycerol kinase family protein [Candidatus Paceibacterota bacterium]